MKLSVSYNFFNGEELLYYAVKHMRPMADHISIVYQEISNTGNKISQNAREVLKKIENENLVDDLILYNPDFSLTLYQNEHRKRKLGYECAKAHTAKYFLCSDADEFYKFDEFQNVKEYILNNDIRFSACHSYFYIKQPFYRSKKIDATNVCFICAIDENTIFKLTEPAPFPNIDGTRSIINKVDRKIFFREDQITMHHMNFVRKDFTSKFKNTSSRKNPHLQNFLKELEQSIVSWKFGQTFHFPQKGSYEIIETDNYFDLPVIETDISSISNLTSEDKREDMQNIRDKLNAPKSDSLLKHSQERKLNVLLATNHLYDYTGSEITLFTIAKKLREKGNTVFVYAKYVNKSFIRIFHDIATVLNSIENLSRYRFDVAYVQHNIIALEVRYQFPKLPMVLASLGVLPFLEQPPLMDLNIHKYLAISEEVKENLIRKGIEESDITIFRNIVDSQKFKLNINLNHQPRSALIYSYKIDENKISKVMKACSKLNIECRHMGEKPGAIHQDELTDWLNKADIIFTLGRGAIETMMCGRIPIIFDHLGGDGMVTPENIDKLMKHNFSGRLYGIQYGVEDIINQIKLYNPENGPILQKKAIELFDADKGVDRLLFYLQDALMNPYRENSFNNHEELNFLIEMINTTKVYTTDTISLSLQRSNDIRTDNPDSPIKLHQKALDLFKQERPHKAIKIMHQAILMDPGNAEYHNDLGVLYFHTGQDDKATELFLRAIELDDAQIDARKNLADLHVAAGRITEAERLYKEILIKKPDDPETLVALQVSNKLSSFYQKTRNRVEEGKREESLMNTVNNSMNQRQIKNKKSSILTDLGANYEIIPCPFCSSHEAETIRSSADIVRCLSCNTIYLRTRMKREVMKKTYQTYADGPSHMALPKDSPAIKNSVLRREPFLKELLEFTKPEGTLLDVGCGWGAFLDNSRDHGFDVLGIEITSKCVSFANKSLGIPVTDEHFEDAAFKDESLSVITMLHVLEHLPEPRKAIENAYRILKPGGIFCGIVPNFTSLCSQELGEEWFWLDPQYHYVHYTPETLKKHLEGIGFSIEKIYTATGDYGRENVIKVIRQKYALSDTDPVDSLFDRIESEGLGEEILFFARKPARSIENISNKEYTEKAMQIICSDAIFSLGNHRCASIIIPVFNQLEYTSLCLDALYKNTPLERIREVIIVDNASSDGTREYLEKACDQFPKLKIMTNKENLLFARACNQGGDIAEGGYLVFLNNDTEPLPGWLDSALERFEKDDSIGIVGIKLLYPDLTVQHCGIQFYRDVNPTYNIWPLHRYMNASADDPRVNIPQDVHAVTGACLFIRRDFFRRIGGFEERYGMYFEDTDLCFKTRRAGKRVFYEPGSVIIHHEGKSSPEQSVIDGLNAKSARLFFKLWKQDLYKYELETFIEKEEGKYVYLSDDFWPESTPEEIGRIHNLLMSFSPCYVHFGGSGDALLLMSTFYDREPEQVVVSVCNSTGMMRSFFDVFPKLKKVYLIPFPENYVWHFVARRCFKSFDICLGLGATPTSKVDYGEWNADLDIFESYGIQKRPSWAVNFNKNHLENRQVTIQPRGSLKGMTGSKRNAINHKNWSQLLSYLGKKGITPIIIGTPEEADEYPCLGNAIDKRSYSFTEQMKLIAASDYFIGADSWGKTFSALAGIPTIVFHAMRGDDLKNWKDASDFIFLDPWEEITVVNDFKAFRKLFDAIWRKRFPHENEMKSKQKQKSHKKKGKSSTPTPSDPASHPMHFYLIRNEGMGDVLMALPAARALKQNYPAGKITFITDKRYEDIIKANPSIDEIITEKGSTLSSRSDSINRRGEKVWQLNPARLGIGKRHQVDAYLDEIKIQIPDKNKEIVLDIPDSFVDKVSQLLKDIIISYPSALNGKRPKIVLLHAAKNDPNRTWPEKHWDRLAQIILEEGYLVITTGSNSSDPKRGVSDISLPGIVNLVDQLSPLEFVALCRESNLLITTDSGVIQLAGASDIAIAGIYTVIPGRCRLPYRHGRLMWNSVSIEPECKYAGCYLWMQNEKYFGPVNDRLKSGKITPHQLFAEWCLSEEKYACLLNQITPEIVWQKSKDLLLYAPVVWDETRETKRSIEELLHRGEECFEHGDLKRAVKVFERVLSLDQTNSQALNNLGVMQWQLGNVPSAINIFQKALTFNPNDRDALENLVQAATETGRLDLISPALLDTMKEIQLQHVDFMRLTNEQKNSINAI